ncbi:hypothetical protein M0802_015161 [Mischocyttarus mexicanus]|nr:hypothetical protein M0802_015161 [Mischocyttarus mexicanus]
MAFVQIIANISNLLNINKHIKNFSIIYNILKQNNRTYWFGNLKKLQFNKKHKNMSESCGKLPLTRIEPSTGQSSKCLKNYDKPKTKLKQRLFKFYKTSSTIKEKPTNCEKIEFKKTKPSLWQRIFGIKSKKSCPASCIHPVTYKKQMKSCKQDPRLLNPSYQSTPGDVLIYTEIIKTNKHECFEPQPIPHHPYKLPRAVLCKMIMSNIEKKLNHYSAVQSPNHNNCKSNKFQTNPILFKEMRPMVKEKSAFTCEDGVTTNNIIQPFNTKMNPYGISFIKLIRNPNNVLSKLLQTKLIDNLKTLKNIKCSEKISKG